MSIVAGVRTLRVSLHVPPSGSWYLDAALEQGPLPSGQALVTVGDLVLAGGVWRAGYDETACPRVVVVGGLGWRSLLIAPGAYTSAAGVRLSTVLRDLAALAVYPGGPTTGETYDAPTESILGPGYGWDAAAPGRPLRARGVLADLSLIHI